MPTTDLTPEDHKTRSRGIGSSEIAMLITQEDKTPLSPWGGPHKLWRKKMGLETQEDNATLARGRYIEPALIDWFCDDKSYGWNKPKTIAKPEQHTVDSVDALIYKDAGFFSTEDQPHRCLEVKTAHFSQANKWGEPGTDEVPDYYNVQCQWHLHHWEPIDWECDLVVDIGAQRKDYIVKYDADLTGYLVELAKKFWIDHVLANKAPDLDHEATAWVNKRLRQKTEDLIEASGDLVQLLEDYAIKKVWLKHEENQVAEMEEKIKTAIGEHAGLKLPDGRKVTWKKSKDSNVVDWRGIAEEYLDQLNDKEATLSAYTTKKEGSRRFYAQALLKI